MVTLDVTRVTRIDTAGLQLLAAFVRERAMHDRPVHWRGESAALSMAAQLLGLSAVLGSGVQSLPGGASHGGNAAVTVDLKQFHGAFFEESFEAIDSMEAALLRLDAGAPDRELINTIFRVAHSIKGGSATFGFGEIASFTHSLETLLDELRSGSMQVTVADLRSAVEIRRRDARDAALRAIGSADRCPARVRSAI